MGKDARIVIHCYKVKLSKSLLMNTIGEL